MSALGNFNKIGENGENSFLIHMSRKQNSDKNRGSVVGQMLDIFPYKKKKKI